MTDTTLSSSTALLAARLQVAVGDAYAVGAPLGSGGFGVVFAATEHELRRNVAIKVLRPEIASPVLCERFRREAEATAGLRHPGIIQIYRVGEQGGLIYFVMPLIQGETMRARLQRDGRLPIGESRRILLETARAVSAAHAAGLVHRDIKPDNILLDGPERRVVLTDFGIAKSLSADFSTRDDEAGTLTSTGLIIGTPAYMSPEQAGGGPAIDHRSDIYSLGVVAFQLLTGELPFTGTSIGAILLQQLRGEPPLVARKRPECPGYLSVAITRCLALEPEERWESAAALIEALERPSGPAVAVAQRAPHGNDARGNDDLLTGFRRTLAGVGALLLVAVAMDLAMGRVLVSPFAFLLGSGIAAAQFGRVWTAGYSWRDVLRRTDQRGAGKESKVQPALNQLRSDRAVILRLLEGVPRAQRGRINDLPSAVDGIVARGEELTRQLEELERRNAEPARPGQQDGVEAARPRDEHGRRGEWLADEVSRCGQRLAKVKRAVQRGPSEGWESVQPEIAAALRAEG